jgi:hypothetical protein
MWVAPQAQADEDSAPRGATGRPGRIGRADARTLGAGRGPARTRRETMARRWTPSIRAGGGPERLAWTRQASPPGPGWPAVPSRGSTRHYPPRHAPASPRPPRARSPRPTPPSDPPERVEAKHGQRRAGVGRHRGVPCLPSAVPTVTVRTGNRWPAKRPMGDITSIAAQVIKATNWASYRCAEGAAVDVGEAHTDLLSSRSTGGLPEGVGVPVAQPHFTRSHECISAYMRISTHRPSTVLGHPASAHQRTQCLLWLDEHEDPRQGQPACLVAAMARSNRVS